MGQQTLANVRVAIGEVADGPYGIAGFSLFDFTLGNALHPHRIAVEVANDAPNPIGGLVDHGTVINLRHIISSLSIDLDLKRFPYVTWKPRDRGNVKSHGGGPKQRAIRAKIEQMLL